MSNLECLKTRLADAATALADAVQAVNVLERLPPDQLALTTRQQAALLVRADKLADKVEDLAEDLKSRAVDPGW